MNDKTNWRAVMLEDGLIVFALISLGLGVVLFKVVPVLLRWAKSAT